MEVSSKSSGDLFLKYALQELQQQENESALVRELCLYMLSISEWQFVREEIKDFCIVRLAKSKRDALEDRLEQRSPKFERERKYASETNKDKKIRIGK